MRGLALTRTVLTVLGTRPEAIKMAPVLRALAAGPLRSVLCVTGQHPELYVDLRPDHDLGAVRPGSDLSELTEHVLRGLRPVLAQVAPDLVVVHGDTTSALAAALAATYAGIPVAHVEAGLRTGDPAAPFPEEVNRGLIDRLAALHLAPTELARANLLAEGIAPTSILVTGNPVVDALAGVRAEPGDHVLVTCHRRESLGAPLLGICVVAASLARSGARVVWPVHPNPAVSEPVREALGGLVDLRPPLPHGAFLQLLASAALVLTDSGGVQEEAALLSRPTLVLREKTERPEVLETGVVRVVGLDPVAIEAAARDWLGSPPSPTGARPLGDGRAGPRIARALERFLQSAVV